MVNRKSPMHVKAKHYAWFAGLLVLAYLLTIAFFAFRPFKPIPGLGYPDAVLKYGDGAVHVRPGAALKDRRNVSKIRAALVQSGEMSLLVELLPDSVEPSQKGRIVAFARDCTVLNFSLNQEGQDVLFELRTQSSAKTDVLAVLRVPRILTTSVWRQLVVTFDGSRIRLFADGKLLGEHVDFSGTFSSWGRDHALVIGDEPAGGQPWSGQIRRVAIYDYALDARKIGLLPKEEISPRSVVDYDFYIAGESASSRKKALKRLRYHNLFIADSQGPPMHDCIVNIVGFIPLGFMVYLAAPCPIKRRKLISAILLPVLVGCIVSGSIESTQRYILLRVPSVLDLVFNVTGTLVGGLFAWLFDSIYGKRGRDGGGSTAETGHAGRNNIDRRENGQCA